VNDFYERAEVLSKHGLYDPDDEHDACGVGVVAAMDGKSSRKIVEAAIEGLKCLWHRGAVDADGKTGDGAGIHLQIPEEFFRRHIESLGKNLEGKRLAVGMIFLPKKNLAAQETCRSIVETEILKFGYKLYGWRQVPVVSEVIGEIANESRPEIEQIIIAGDVGKRNPLTGAKFERDLYIIRKRIEKAVRTKAIADFYICSLSCRSLIYKGLFRAEQLTAFYPDLLDELFVSNYAIFHQRFSTNTAPAWHLAQPFRMIAHNGEINTLRGNVNFMKSHEATFHCAEFDGYIDDVTPVIPDNTSDTGALDSVIEILTRAGRSLPLAKLIAIPPAWSFMVDMPKAHKDMFTCFNCISEQWDGPAAIVGSDGEWAIAGMDRNGLRPLRYTITTDNILVVASESGMINIPDNEVVERGRIGPGDIIGVNLKQGKLYKDSALKDLLSIEQPYSEWVKNIKPLSKLLEKKPSLLKTKVGKIPAKSLLSKSQLLRAQKASGITMEEVESIIHPMAETGKEATGSMGDDAPIAVLSAQHRPFHHFFRQNFSQVTNPPIDPIRERSIMSLYTRFGNDGNYLQLDHSHGEILLAERPVLVGREIDAVINHYAKRISRIDTLFPADKADESGKVLEAALDSLMQKAEQSVAGGRPYLILTDENLSEKQAIIPMILAVSAINTHLTVKKLRKRASIIVKTSECWDAHALAVLIGAGATVVNPYLAEATIVERQSRGLLSNLTIEKALDNFAEAMSQGLLKIMSKMGISVVSSYRGGLNFEALGLSRALVSCYFPGMPSRISGIGLAGIEKRCLRLHKSAFVDTDESSNILPLGGFYRYRANQEKHAWEGQAVHLLQSAVSKGAYQLYKQYAEMVYAQPPIHIRDLLSFRNSTNTRASVAPVTLDQVESINEIRKRFVAPAMSLGALSPEAHQILAIAMNRMGAASNSGEGGEGEERFTPLENGDNANSTIKQIASARFGVTAEYLNSAREIQIKVAQGAKPGEGGQLPGFKVTMEIARLRHATPGVMLISPPPHHDIYSIEDLAQLIYDLKQINPEAIVSVKLVSQSGIGTIASGVAKAMADKIVIAGHSGGTGASPWSSIKFAGAPWEMGLAEANQVLTLNRLRHRVRLQTDGGLKTGRDIVIAAMLGAEEYALGTASLVAMGCILVRQCHSNTCPVGITTQDPALRAKFDGTVEKVVNLFSFVAEEIREILASLGFTSLEQVIGRSDLLYQTSRGGDDLVDLDLNNLLAVADAGGKSRFCKHNERNEVPDTLDAQMLSDVERALKTGEKIQLAFNVSNTMRAIGARISSAIVKSAKNRQISDDQINLHLRGSAGQSLGAFAARGLKIELFGDANDYVGKGLSGGTIIVRPRPSSKLVPQDNVIIGNTVLYGATSGKLFACGQAGERFAVRNSGALAVVEGCGSNGCEYMTGGTVVILGKVGHNFGAGMTGGMAFVYDSENNFAIKANSETIVYQRLASSHWENQLKSAIAAHFAATGSPLANYILTGWEWESVKFWQICPKEMIARLENPLTSEKIKQIKK
jgi:glutamate synthase (NADPH/NADH) large chain